MLPVRFLFLRAEGLRLPSGRLSTRGVVRTVCMLGLLQKDKGIVRIMGDNGFGPVYYIICLLIDNESMRSKSVRCFMIVGIYWGKDTIYLWFVVTFADSKWLSVCFFE